MATAKSAGVGGLEFTSALNTAEVYVQDYCLGELGNAYSVIFPLGYRHTRSTYYANLYIRKAATIRAHKDAPV